MDTLVINTILAGMLVVARITGFFATVPLLGASNVPNRIKLALALTLAVTVLTVHGQAALKAPLAHDVVELIVLMASEMAVGLMLGFATDLTLHALRLAGEMISFQMGLSIANVLDPTAGMHTPIMAEIYVMFALLLMLVLNVHHHLIWAVDRTYHWFPLGHVMLNSGLMATRFLALISEMMSFGLLVAAPTMGVMFVTEVAIAFVAKVMPQMNVFTVSVPLKCAMGMMLVAVTFPNVAQLIEKHDGQMIQQLMLLFATSAKGA